MILSLNYTLAKHPCKYGRNTTVIQSHWRIKPYCINSIMYTVTGGRIVLYRITTVIRQWCTVGNTIPHTGWWDEKKKGTWWTYPAGGMRKYGAQNDDVPPAGRMRDNWAQIGDLTLLVGWENMGGHDDLPLLEALSVTDDLTLVCEWEKIGPRSIQSWVFTCENKNMAKLVLAHLAIIAHSFGREAHNKWERELAI